MTRRNVDDVPSHCTNMEMDGGMMSPPPQPPQASPAERSPEAPPSPATLATMTPVNVMELKKEIDHSPLYAHVKTESSYDKEEDLYHHSHAHAHAHPHPQVSSSAGPIDMIYEDGNKTVIYATAGSDKGGGLEIYSTASSGEIVAHQIHGQMTDVLIENGGGGGGGGGAGNGNAEGTVSVVLQGNGHQGLLQYPQTQVPGTTVLVLSELVDDMSVPVVGLRKRSSKDSLASTEQCNGGELAGAVRGMAELDGQQGGGEDQHTWRAFCEHPLTAATAAMLNLGSGGDEHAPAMGLVYECYKLPAMADGKEKLQDIWQSGAQLPSQLKPSNGLLPGAGLELSGAAQLTTQELQGLFINQYPQPVQNLLVKREPEDLSHHRKADCGSPGNVVDAGILLKHPQRHKVVLVSSSSAQHPSELVVDVNSIKDESQSRLLGSPQHQDRGSVTGTPTSTHSSLLADGSTTGPIEFIPSDGIRPAMYTAQIFASMSAGSGSPSPVSYSVAGGPETSYAHAHAHAQSSGSISYTSAPAYYREYGSAEPTPVYTAQLRQSAGASGQLYPADDTVSGSASSFVDRYVRQSQSYHGKGVIAAATAAGLTVDLPSPDSGIGADAITPRDQNALQQSFDYTELCQTNSSLLDPLQLSQRSNSSTQSPGSQPPSRSRPWHDFGRQNDADKIQIPKIFSPVGFKYNLETPISTSQRREDDRITYINKGQFYGITLEYIPDADKQLKSQTVKSIVMLMFREEKSPEDEIKAWQFWHGRQHSVKQRILDADTKNSVGLVGCIEEVAHNAIAIYWNPLESPAKINIAVQCLSTDFSSQKGVKGLPLHLQIDTYEDPRDSNIFHRGYCQIKVFCDKGAERKTRDEERRAAKRKMTATGRKKLDELYHPVCERSEFYSMSDLAKPPVLFSPAEDIDKLTSMELQGFYSHDQDSLPAPLDANKSPFLLHAATKTPAAPTLKFHNHFPPDGAEKKDVLLESALGGDAGVFSPPLKRAKVTAAAAVAVATTQPAGPPPLNERVMLYVRQESEDVYTPLHVVPPTTVGLLNAIENKYKISASSINNLFRKNKKGITAKIDDDMVAYYCNEDLFLLELKAVDEDLYDITFVELNDH